MPHRRRTGLLAFGLLLLLGSRAAPLRAEPPADAPMSAATFTDEQIAFFEKQVRPLLLERCAKCHCEGKQQGNLRLDSRDAILAGGDLGSAVTPGDPEASLLVDFVGYAGDIQMPPDGKLRDREIAVIEQWVRDGLAWPAEATPGGSPDQVKVEPKPIPWSFVPVVEPVAPEVSQPAWCQSPLDRFVLAGLDAAGLHPAAPAEKRTLIRRAKFDLLGLPPTPEEINAFLADDAPDAFARLVDRYLAMPEYGQRWGRHWLDVARYADSNGQDENLAYVNAFRYRDYVVDAFNSDKPYDQFVREQIAGDLLPGVVDDGQRFERLVATGFLTLGPKMLAEDDPVKMEMDIVDEQLDTLGGAFLGLTLGCARCHDHKFDPISTADYYALAGIFKSTRTMDNFKVVAHWHERPLASDADVAALADYRTRRDAKQAEIAALVERADTALVATARARLADYLLAASELLDAPPLVSQMQRASDEGMSLPPGTVEREAEEFDRGNVLIDTSGYGAGIGVILNRGELPNFTEYELELAQPGWYQLELRYAAAQARPVQILINGQVRKSDAAAEVTGSWNPDSQRWSPETILELPAGKLVLRIERAAGPIPHFDRLALVPREDITDESAAAPRSTEELASQRGLIASFLDQWTAYLTEERKNTDSIWQPWFAYREQGDLAADQFTGAAVSVARRILEPGEPADAAELARRYQSAIEAAVERGEEATDPTDLALWQVVVDAKGPLRVIADARTQYASEDQDEHTRLERELAELDKSAPPAPPLAMAVADGAVTDLPIHIRGSHLSLGRVVPRDVPAVLRHDAVAMPDAASGRAELAVWITDPAHPLTSRVMVNRLWRWHFGAGIVRSTDNFGNLGELPSHPELLDWLATEFVRSGWSVKAMHRAIMLSSTYQMRAAYDAEAAEADPDNRLLWRMNRRRLEAEAVRDSLLFVSESLDTTLGGSLLHSKPREYVTGTASVNSTDYDTARRSLYLPVVRSAVYEALQAFDFAEPTVIQGDRNATTIASQALFMMNSDIVEEQTSRLAARIVAKQPNDATTRVQSLYEIALGRAASDTEAARAAQFVERYQSTLSGDAAATELSAWQALCRVIVSSNEFLYVE